jgi:PAS domain S-box-containing protein
MVALGLRQKTISTSSTIRDGGEHLILSPSQGEWNSMKHLKRVDVDLMPHHAFSRFFGQLIHAIPTSVPVIWGAIGYPIRWLHKHSFTPRWIPQRWQPPPVGYTAALLLQIALGLISMTVLRSFPDFNFFGILQLLGVLVIAWLWGVGPSLFSTFTGAAVIVLFHRDQFLQESIGVVADLMGLGIYLIVGCAISSLVSQAIHARNDAEQLAQSLQREKSRLDAVIEAVPDELSIRDTHGTLIQMNQAARETTDITMQSLPMHTMGDLLPLWTLNGHQISEQDVPLVAVARGERIREMEYMKYLPDGQKQYLSYSMAPIALDAGEVEEVVVISHDITRLKQAQQAEAQRANEFEVLFDSLVDGVIVMDLEGRIVRANAAYRKLCADLRVLNLTLRERMAYFDIHTGQGASIPLEEMPNMRILRGEVLQGPTAVDLLVHSPTQGVRYHNTNGAPIRDEAGTITGGVMVLRDFTERRQLEKRTRDALDALVAIASEIVRMPLTSEPVTESAGQRIAELTCRVLNCNRVVITTVNPPHGALRFVAITGFTPNQASQLQTCIEGREIDKCFSTQQIARLRRGEVLTVAMAASVLTDLDFLSPRAMIAPLLIEDRLIGIMVISLETQEDPIPSEDLMIAATIAKLSALVLEREQLLHQQADAQARILALQQAKERMDIFLNMASHELRTPLTSVTGYIQLARKRLSRLQEAPEDWQMSQLTYLIALLDDADNQATFLNRLVGDLLEASRAEARKLSLQYAVCDVTAMAQEAIQGQLAAWPDRHISLRHEEGEPLLAQVDKGRILQVLTNYLTNALKYSPSDRPVLVRARRDGEYIRVLVSDAGPGIPTEEQDHIWERFYRIEGIKPQDGEIPGLGMGLYLSRVIVEQHGGQVGVESRVGEGSTFWFTLPMYHEGS